jgi:hypothetical protein
MHSAATEYHLTIPSNVDKSALLMTVLVPLLEASKPNYLQLSTLHRLTASLSYYDPYQAVVIATSMRGSY